MKRIFTFAIALMSMFATVQLASAANVVFKVTVPTPTYQVWIVGSFNGWNNNLNQLTKVDDTHYTITMDDATWNAGVTVANVEYKYCSGGGDWAYVEKDALGAELAANRKYTAGVDDVVAKWANVYNPNVLPLPMNVTIDVLTPAGTVQCYIVGTFNGWAGPTAPADSVKMKNMGVNPDGTVIFEKTIYTADANKLAYHFCSGPDWAFEQKAPAGDYKYPEVAPVVTEWKKLYDPSKVGIIKMTVTPPAGTEEMWIQGSHLGWKMDAAKQGVKNTDGTFTFSNVGVQSMEYRFYNHPGWAYHEVDSTGAERKNRVADYPNDSVLKLTVINWKTTTLTYTVTVPKTTKFCYIVGGMNGWNPSANLMTKVDSIHYKIDFPLGKTLDEYKYVCGPDWKYEEVDTAGVALKSNRTWKDGGDVVAKWKEIYSFINEINTDKYTIYSSNHSLVVEGVNSQVEVIDISGRVIQNQKLTGKFVSKKLNSGLYILRIDGATKKMVVN
jgi:hypothetical protein